MESEALTKIDSAVARIVTNLEALAAKHGQDVVDLSLFAYQLDALSKLAIGILGLGLIYLSTRLIRLSVADSRKPFDDQHLGVQISAGIGSVVAMAVGIFMGSALLSAPRWMAAFGYPEVQIATNALRAAGLL